MDHAHRRVELQSPADLQHIRANASRAARAKIDLHFPPRAATAPTTSTDDAVAVPPTDDDPLRKRVEELVQAFLERTFASVRQNVAVNGLSGAELEKELADAVGAQQSETEPFDTALARRVQAASSNIESLTLQLATLRRDAPARTARKYAAALEREEQLWREEMAGAQRADAQRQPPDLAVGELKDVDAMRTAWEEGTRRLKDVKDGVGGVQARLEKARDAVVYLAEA